jgi:hypothetical protein
MKHMNMTNLQQIPGVGIDAVWGTLSVAGKSVCQLFARKDKSALIGILITGIPDTPETLIRVKTLANQILARLE